MVMGLVPSAWLLLTTAMAVFSTAVALRTSAGTTATTLERPMFVQRALENREQPIYYFGMGSNMLRSKLEGRGTTGTSIEIMDIEPAVVPGHRLSFNLRGFLPLEPGMGSLEPVDSGNLPMHAFELPECHGALIKLSPENYEKVMASEGISPKAKDPGYEEVIVTCYPYDPLKEPVQAISLRAKANRRLTKDPCPSQRYMDLLIEGAAELGLKPDYQQFLSSHPVQVLKPWLRRIAINNMICMLTVSFVLKWRAPSELQSWCMFKAYVPSNAPALPRTVSDLLMAAILLPGAFAGLLLQLFLKATGKDVPPMLKRFIGIMEGRKDEPKPTSSLD